MRLFVPFRNNVPMRFSRYLAQSGISVSGFTNRYNQTFGTEHGPFVFWRYTQPRKHRQSRRPSTRVRENVQRLTEGAVRKDDWD